MLRHLFSLQDCVKHSYQRVHCPLFKTSPGMSSRPLIVFPLIILFIAACCQSQLPVFMLVLVCMYLLTCSALLMYYKPTEKKTLGVFLSWISSLCFSGTSISIHLFSPILCTFPHLHSGSFSHLHPRVWVLIIDAILYILLHFLSFLNVKPATKRQEMHRKTWQCWTGLSQWSRSALTQHAVTFLDSYKSGYSVGYKADFLLKHKYPVTLYLMIHWLSSIRPLAFFFPQHLQHWRLSLLSWALTDPVWKYYWWAPC